MAFDNAIYYLLSKMDDLNLMILPNGQCGSADFDQCVASYRTWLGTVFETKVLGLDGNLHWPFGEYTNHVWLQKYLPPDTVGILAREPPDPLPNSELAAVNKLRVELDALCNRYQQVQTNDRRLWITMNEIAEKSLYQAPGELVIPRSAMHEISVGKFRDLALGYTRYNKYDSMRLA